MEVVLIEEQLAAQASRLWEEEREGCQVLCDRCATPSERVFLIRPRVSQFDGQSHVTRRSAIANVTQADSTIAYRTAADTTQFRTAVESTGVVGRTQGSGSSVDFPEVFRLPQSVSQNTCARSQTCLDTNRSEHHAQHGSSSDSGSSSVAGRPRLLPPSPVAGPSRPDTSIPLTKSVTFSAAAGRLAQSPQPVGTSTPRVRHSPPPGKKQPRLWASATVPSGIWHSGITRVEETPGFGSAIQSQAPAGDLPSLPAAQAPIAASPVPMAVSTPKTKHTPPPGREKQRLWAAAQEVSSIERMEVEPAAKAAAQSAQSQEGQKQTPSPMDLPLPDDEVEEAMELEPEALPEPKQAPQPVPVEAVAVEAPPPPVAVEAPPPPVAVEAPPPPVAVEAPPPPVAVEAPPPPVAVEAPPPPVAVEAPPPPVAVEAPRPGPAVAGPAGVPARPATPAVQQRRRRQRPAPGALVPTRRSERARRQTERYEAPDYRTPEYLRALEKNRRERAQRRRQARR